jgi:uncharacterized membrane protein YeiB
MWLLSWLPDSFLIWIIDIILLVGVIGTVASVLFKLVIKYLPWAIPYRLLLQVVSVVLLIIGVYLKGGYAVESEWRARVAELEAKIAIAEQQSKEANVKIVTVYKDRIKVVKETQVVIQERIKEIEKRIDSQCTIDSSVIDILNDAAVRKPK